MRSVMVMLVAVCLALATTAKASFHFMQIEQIIGGVNGNTTMQAVQLRMRAAGQNLIASGGTSLRVVDAAGNNPITLIAFPTNVSNSAGGARILVASQAFINATNPVCAPDFVIFSMQNLIPASYLTAGKLIFGAGPTIYWSVSWGGAAYTGPNTGNSTNDPDGNFGPPFAGPLPSTSLQALRFTGAATAASTSNSLQYAVTAGAAVFNNNAGTSFTVVAPPPPPCPADFNHDTFVDPDDLADYITCFFLDVETPGTCPGSDFNGDGFRDPDDLSDFITAFFTSTC